MFEYNDKNIGIARTRDEMFKEEQLVMQQKILDMLTQIRDAVVPKSATAPETEIKPVPGSIIEIPKKPSTARRTKK